MEVDRALTELQLLLEEGKEGEPQAWQARAWTLILSAISNFPPDSPEVERLLSG